MITILDVFKKKTGHGTQCQGLLDEEVLGHRLALMISKIFSKLVHSVRLEQEPCTSELFHHFCTFPLGGIAAISR